MKKLNSILLVAAIITFIACLWVNVDRNKTIENSHTVRYIAAEGGYIDGKTEQLVEDGGSSDVVIARPNSGYEFAGWSDGVSAAGRREVRVHNDITVTAYFTPENSTADPDSPDNPDNPDNPDVPDADGPFVLRYTASEGGHILMEGVPPASSVSQKVAAGESGTAVTAVPDGGYGFVRWSDGVTTATRTDDNVMSDITVTAEFRRIELTLTYAAGTGGSIIGETSQTVQYGESGTAVTAVPDEGYEFVRWSDGVTTATRTDDNVTSDITVTAEFRLVENTTDFAGGIGTTEHPYEVATFKHLRNMELFPDAHYVLTADIVLSEAGEGGSNFAPLFSDEGMFGGTLDGQGHKISNLTVYNTETFYSGLFSCISASGSVTNLVLENASVSGTNYIGGIAGYTLGAVTDCTVTGSITYLGGNGYKVFAGGIAGRAKASVDGCVTDVTVTVEDARAETNVGGIVGYLAYGGSQSEPMTLRHSGSITVTVDTSVNGNNARVGGLIGYANTSVYLSSSSHNDDITVSARDTYLGGLIGAGNTNLTACSTKGSLTAKAAYTSYAGGLVGSGDTVTVTDSHATGNVTSTGNSDSYAGGLVGSGSSTVTDSYATGDVTSTNTGSWGSYAGGLVGNGSSTVTDSYATGDVTSTGNYSYAGGLVGYGDTVTVRNSYSVSCVSAESEGGNVYIGGLAGYVDSSLTLENAHWYGGDGTAAEYAVGYSNSLGIPTSIGSTRHNSVEEFHTLANVLNAGREEPVWEHTNVNTLPTLIARTEGNQ